MHVSLEVGDGLRRQLRVDLPAASIEAEVEKRLREVARSARLPGFRPGKVPLKVIRRRFGDSVRGEVLSEQVRASLPEAVAQSAVRPAEAPAIEPKIDVVSGSYGYVARFEALPEIELAPLDEQSIQRPVADISDDDVTAMISRLRQQRRVWAPVDRPAETGDQLRISLEGSVDGTPLPDVKETNVSVELGSGRGLPGLEDGLVGASPGEHRLIDVDFPAEHQSAEVAGKRAQVAVEIHEISEAQLPALDEHFAKALGIADGNVERLHADVRANMGRELEQRVKGRVKSQVMELLFASNSIALPQVLVEREIAMLKAQAGQRVGSASELPDTLFEDAARRRVALGLIIAEVVRQNELSPPEEKVRAAVETLASTYQDPQAVTEYYYGDRKRLESIESLVLEDEVVDFVMSRVTVVEEPTTFEALVGSMP